MAKQEDQFLAVRYKDDKPKETLNGTWNEDTETLHWIGQRLGGGEYNIRIHLPKGGGVKTHLVMKTSNGKVEYEWKGASKLIKMNTKNN